ncbi:MAG: Myo-inositol 2-dehydrogenase, partial [uncultured Rubrobacteraceae bacterium]
EGSCSRGRADRFFSGEGAKRVAGGRRDRRRQPDGRARREAGPGGRRNGRDHRRGHRLRARRGLRLAGDGDARAGAAPLHRRGVAHLLRETDRAHAAGDRGRARTRREGRSPHPDRVPAAPRPGLPEGLRGDTVGQRRHPLQPPHNRPRRRARPRGVHSVERRDVPRPPHPRLRPGALVDRDGDRAGLRGGERQGFRPLRQVRRRGQRSHPDDHVRRSSGPHHGHPAQPPRPRLSHGGLRLGRQPLRRKRQPKPTPPRGAGRGSSEQGPVPGLYREVRGGPPPRDHSVHRSDEGRTREPLSPRFGDGGPQGRGRLRGVPRGRQARSALGDSRRFDGTIL